MKTLVLTFKRLAGGDTIIVEYSAKGGGCTHVKHKILGERKAPVLDEDGFIVDSKLLPQQSAQEIADILRRKINTEWMNEAFEARMNDAGQLIIGCTGLVQDVVFRAYANGKGGTAVEFAEF